MSDEADLKPKRLGALTRLRNYFLTGFIVSAPIAITVYLVWAFIGWVDSWVIPYIPDVYNPDQYLPFSVPGFGLIIALFIITLIGFLTAGIIGRSIVSYGEHMLNRMPLIRNLYSALKQIIHTVFSQQETSFEKIGLLEYPRKDIWAVVFIATETKGEVGAKLQKMGQDTLSVFLPTTPNPTSGFLLFVPKEDVKILDMSVEDGAKLVISAGLVAPEYEPVVRKIARKSAAKKR